MDREVLVYMAKCSTPSHERTAQSFDGYLGIDVTLPCSSWSMDGQLCPRPSWGEKFQKPLEIHVRLIGADQS